MDLDNCSVIRARRVDTDATRLDESRYSYNVEGHSSTLVGHRIYVMGGERYVDAEREGCIVSYAGYRHFPEDSRLLHVLDTNTWCWAYLCLRCDVRSDSEIFLWAERLDILVGDRLFVVRNIQWKELAVFFCDLSLGTLERYETIGGNLIMGQQQAGEYVEEFNEVVTLVCSEVTPSRVVVLRLDTACWMEVDTKGTAPPWTLFSSSLVSTCAHGRFDVFFFADAKGGMFRLRCVTGTYTWSQPIWSVQATPRSSAIMRSTGNRIFVFGGQKKLKLSNELFVGETRIEVGYKLNRNGMLKQLRRVQLSGHNKIGKLLRLVGGVPRLGKHSAVIAANRLIILGGSHCPNNAVIVLVADK